MAMKAEEVLAIAIAKSKGGGGTGDGDMKKAVYDNDSAVSNAGGIKDFVNDLIDDFDETLGTLAKKSSVSGTYTPTGSVSVSKEEDTTATVNSITDVGTLPTITVSGEDMTITVGTLPTKGADVSVVTASGSVSASFTGTEATISSN